MGYTLCRGPLWCTGTLFNQKKSRWVDRFSPSHRVGDVKEKRIASFLYQNNCLNNLCMEEDWMEEIANRKPKAQRILNTPCSFTNRSAYGVGVSAGSTPFRGVESAPHRSPVDPSSQGAAQQPTQTQTYTLGRVQ